MLSYNSRNVTIKLVTRTPQHIVLVTYKTIITPSGVTPGAMPSSEMSNDYI